MTQSFNLQDVVDDRVLVNSKLVSPRAYAANTFVANFLSDFSTKISSTDDIFRHSPPVSFKSNVGIAELTRMKGFFEINDVYVGSKTPGFLTEFQKIDGENIPHTNITQNPGVYDFKNVSTESRKYQAYSYRLGVQHGYNTRDRTKGTMREYVGSIVDSIAINASSQILNSCRDGLYADVLVSSNASPVYTVKNYKEFSLFEDILQLTSSTGLLDVKTMKELANQVANAVGGTHIDNYVMLCRISDYNNYAEESSKNHAALPLNYAHYDSFSGIVNGLQFIGCQDSFFNVDPTIKLPVLILVRKGSYSMDVGIPQFALDQYTGSDSTIYQKLFTTAKIVSPDVLRDEVLLRTGANDISVVSGGRMDAFVATYTVKPDKKGIVFFTIKQK